MIFKLLGSLIVLLSSGFLGYILSTDCKKRPQQLRELQALLQMFENQISYLSDVLAEAFERIYRSSNCEVAVFFSSTVEKLKMNRGLNASQAWEAAIRENIKKTALDKEDEEILVSFGRILGSSDLDGQVKNIRLALSQLKMQEQKAEANRKKNEGMYKSLGILGGLAVVIVLI
jgi:stage III sporulation protein AB